MLYDLKDRPGHRGETQQQKRNRRLQSESDGEVIPPSRFTIHSEQARRVSLPVMHNLEQCADHKIFRHDVRKEGSSTNNSLTVVGEVRCDPIEIDFVQS